MDYKIRVRSERREAIDIDKLVTAVLLLAREKAARAKADERRKRVRRAS